MHIISAYAIAKSNAMAAILYHEEVNTSSFCTISKEEMTAPIDLIKAIFEVRLFSLKLLRFLDESNCICRESNLRPQRIELASTNESTTETRNFILTNS